MGGQIVTPGHSATPSLLLSELKGAADVGVAIAGKAQTGSPGSSQVRCWAFWGAHPSGATHLG